MQTHVPSDFIKKLKNTVHICCNRKIKGIVHRVFHSVTLSRRSIQLAPIHIYIYILINSCNAHIHIQYKYNIFRNKGNQAVKFGPMRNIFLEKSYTKCDGKFIPRPFSKKSKLRIPLNQLSKALYSLFLLYVKLRTIKSY